MVRSLVHWTETPGSTRGWLPHTGIEHILPLRKKRKTKALAPPSLRQPDADKWVIFARKMAKNHPFGHRGPGALGVRAALVARVGLSLSRTSPGPARLPPVWCQFDAPGSQAVEVTPPGDPPGQETSEVGGSGRSRTSRLGTTPGTGGSRPDSRRARLEYPDPWSGCGMSPDDHRDPGFYWRDLQVISSDPVPQCATITGRMEQDPHPQFDRPEPLILTGRDADLLQTLLPAAELERLQQAEAGQLPCPSCETPLWGLVMIALEYQGLTLVCPGCGFCEY